MSLASWSLLTLQDAKDHLSVTGNEMDAVVEGLVESASLMCEEYVDRQLMTRTYSAEIYDGQGGLALKLRQFPITSVTSVEFLTGGPPDEWTTQSLTTYGSYVLQPVYESIAFRNLWFPRGSQNVRVTYVAGYSTTTLPRAIKDACRIAVKALWDVRDKQNAGIASQSNMGGQTVVYDKAALPKMWAVLLDPYARWAWV